jgi:hypothetical protein
MRIVPLVAVVVSLAVPALALGHGTGIHARGTVKEIAADRVVVAAKGADQAFAIGPETSVVRGTQKVRIEDVRAGERVVVHAQRDGEKLRATELRLAPAASAARGQKKR